MTDSIGPSLPARLDEDRLSRAEQYFASSRGSISERLEAFPRFVDRSTLGRFVIKYELVKLAAGVHGSIVECGVYDGGGLFSFAQASTLVEPLNHRRRIIGFDSFEGFPAVGERDTVGGYEHARDGAYHGASLEELEAGIELFDADRPIAQVPKVHLVAGDFLESGPRFVRDNSHLIVSLLYLDFDLYEPTAKALELFLPLMPAGAVLAFDEFHAAEWPGETQAVLDGLNFSRLSLQRFPFSSISYAVLTGDERS